MSARLLGGRENANQGQKFRESLVISLRSEDTKDHSLGRLIRPPLVDGADQTGLSLREMIHEFKYQTLVLFKCLLLQPKVCVSHVERSDPSDPVRCCSSVPDASGYA